MTYSRNKISPARTPVMSSIVDNSSIVRPRDEDAWGEYCTKRVLLEIYKAIAGSIRSGYLYKTHRPPIPVSPTLGPRTECEPGMIRMEEANGKANVLAVQMQQPE